MFSIILISILLFLVALFVWLNKLVARRMSSLSPEEFQAWFQKNYLGMGDPIPGLQIRKTQGETRQKDAA